MQSSYRLHILYPTNPTPEILARMPRVEGWQVRACAQGQITLCAIAEHD